MTFILPQLPYKNDALAPFLSAETIEFHYGKHHQAYVTNLNNLVPGSPFEKSDLEDIIKRAEGAIFNNAAQIWNHTFYFESFTPGGNKLETGKLAEAINKTFGSFDGFKEHFTKAAVTLFGAGWAWLVKDHDGNLQIVIESNAGNPLRRGLKPILTCDVWEHAYYIDYRNRRADYVKAFWEIIDWNKVASRY
jgi:superoxide dismutase, Fe-Mn family